MRSRKAHIFDREAHDHYVEPHWVSQRLFEVEYFYGAGLNAIILDPACGWGRILGAAATLHYDVMGSDIVDRLTVERFRPNFRVLDFTSYDNEASLWWRRADAIVTNPPFDRIEDFFTNAFVLMSTPTSNIKKIAFIFPTRRLNAARWLIKTPLRRIWLLTPRPSMPTGEHVRSGGKIGGGTVDYCWLIWNHGYVGRPEIGWLCRDDAGKSKDDRRNTRLSE